MPYFPSICDLFAIVASVEPIKMMIDLWLLRIDKSYRHPDMPLNLPLNFVTVWVDGLKQSILIYVRVIYNPGRRKKYVYFFQFVLF